MKKLSKKIIAAIVAAVLLIGGGLGIHAFTQRNKKVDVFSVASLNVQGYQENLSSYGFVYDGDSQSVNVEPSQIVNKVYVSEGDSVKAGDPLIQFDTESQQLTIELKELEVEEAQDRLAELQSELNKLLNTKPVERKSEDVPADEDTEEPEEDSNEDESEPAPKPEKEKIKDAYSILDSLEDNLDSEADGSEEKPYRFLAAENGIIQGTFFNKLNEEKKFAVVEVRKGNTLDGKLIVSHTFNGEELRHFEDYETFFATTLEYAGGSGGILWDQAVPGDGTYTGDAQSGDTFNPNSTTPSGGPNPTTPSSDPSDSGTSDVEYTAEELANAIAQTRKDISSADLTYRKLALDLKILKENAGDGIVYAKKDGVVTIAHDKDDIPQDGTPMVKVSSGEGVMIQGIISELLLDQVQPGQTVNVNCWETQESYNATVSSVDDFPSNDEMYYGGNPNSSFYNFYAYIEDAADIPEYAYLDLTFDAGENAEQNISISNAYIRDDAKGKYVMKDDNGRLAKQYITTGGVFWGEYVEILDGLTLDDAIAFPYGDGAKEGTLTQMVEEGMMY